MEKLRTAIERCDLNGALSLLAEAEEEQKAAWALYRNAMCGGCSEGAFKSQLTTLRQQVKLYCKGCVNFRRKIGNIAHCCIETCEIRSICSEFKTGVK